MERGILNYIIDAGLALTFILTFFTGLLKWPRLISFFGITHRDLPMLTINLIHDWSGLAMGLLVFVHLILHWRWIVAFTKKIFSAKKKNQASDL